MLASLDQVLDEVVDDNALLHPVTKSLRKRDEVQSRFFGHSIVYSVKENVSVNSVAYQKCCDQIGSKFGCIPVGEIALFDGTNTYWEKS